MSEKMKIVKDGISYEIEKNADNKDSDIKQTKKSKTAVILFIIIGILLIGVITVLYARFIGTSGIFVKEYPLYNDKITTSFDGAKIVHLSDIHYGSIVDDKYLDNLAAKVNEFEPEIVVITGDLIDKKTIITEEDKTILKDFLNSISAVYGKYIIGGNHDYNITQFVNIIDDTSFIHLNNTYDVIYTSNNESIFIAGIESFIEEKNDVNKALNVLNSTKTTDETGAEVVTKSEYESSYKILLMHEPDYIDSILENYEIDLVLAGHSHNGQVRLPFIGAITTPDGAKKYYKPYYKIDDNTELYISSGIGTSTLPFRLFDRPSFNFYRLNTSK